MARVDVVLPNIGESVTEVSVVRWLKKVGDKVAIHESLCEILSLKADMEIPAPVAGVLVETLVPLEVDLPIGTVICRIETNLQ